MNMVVPDIRREPTKHRWQHVERTSFHGRAQGIPIPPAGPIHAIELVLHIEKPDSHGPGEPDHGQLDENLGSQADSLGCNQNDNGDNQIGK